MKNNINEVKVKFSFEKTTTYLDRKTVKPDISNISDKIVKFKAKKVYQSNEPSEIHFNNQSTKIDTTKVLFEIQNRNIEEIYKKITELIENKDVYKQKAVIDLKHPAFGKLEINVEKMNDEIVIRFVFENKESKEIIEKGLHILRERMGNLGLEVKEYSFEIKEEQEWYEEEKRERDSEQHKRQRRRWVKNDDELDTDE